MPHKEGFECISFWVPEGTKNRLRILAAEMGYNGLSELIKACINDYEARERGVLIKTQPGAISERNTRR